MTAVLALALLPTLSVHGARRNASTLRTFGTGRSAFVLTSNETTVFSYQPGGVLTHFWTTAGTQEASDNMTVRYYIDG